MELKDWGIAVRDITRMMALERHRDDTRGVLVDSIRGGGGAATAKLPLQSEDVIVQGRRPGRGRRRRAETHHRRTPRRQDRAGPRPGPLRARQQTTADGREDRAGREQEPPRLGQQTLVQHGHAGVDLRPGRVAGHGRQARRPRHRGLQGPGGGDRPASRWATSFWPSTTKKSTPRSPATARSSTR